MIRSTKIRKSARGEACTIRIPGVCNHNPETTVFAHRPGGGMGLKGHDLFGAYACSACHDAMDGRTGGLDPMDKDFFWLRAQDRTQLALHEKGILVIK